MRNYSRLGQNLSTIGVLPQAIALFLFGILSLRCPDLTEFRLISRVYFVSFLGLFAVLFGAKKYKKSQLTLTGVRGDLMIRDWESLAVEFKVTSMTLKTNLTVLLAMLLTYTALVSFVALTRTGRFNVELLEGFKIQTDWSR